MERLKNLYCICGPSGSGKTTLADILEAEYGMHPVVSYTTRPMRVGEVDGTGHFFITEEAFDELGELAAYTKFDHHRYGTTKKELEKYDLFVIDPAGIKYLKKHVTERRIITFGLDPGSDVCWKRMLGRGDTEQKVAERIYHDLAIYNHGGFLSAMNVMLDTNLSPEELAKQTWALIQYYEGQTSAMQDNAGKEGTDGVE